MTSPMTTPRKTAIAARFDAAHDYEQAASIQKRCAHILAGHIRHAYAARAPEEAAHAPPLNRSITHNSAPQLPITGLAETHPHTPHRILEFGCGTGLLSRELAASFPNAALYLTDLAPAMLERTARALAGQPVEDPAFAASHPAGPGRTSCPPQTSSRMDQPCPDLPSATPPHTVSPLRHTPRLFVMDGEAPHLPEDVQPGFDLITSSLCLQWFEDRAAAFRALAALLKPGGRLMVSTLLTGTLQQWRESCKTTAIPCGVPDYPSLAQLQQDWPQNGHGHWEACPMEDPTPSARYFLKGLRMIGAALPREGHRPASGLRQAMRHFDAHHNHVTYQVAFGLFQKEH